jgi:hypothetical protein
MKGKHMGINRQAVRKTSDGMAVIGTVKHDIMGLRFDDLPDGNVADGNALDAATENGSEADPRDAIITQLTAALALANKQNEALKAVNAAMILSVAGGTVEDDEAPSIDDDEEPDFSDVLDAATD